MGNVVAEASGPLMVLGAAGTGKTSLVVDAVAARMRRGEPPALVFALTRRAASELRDRVVRASGRTTLAPQVMTIHAFCRGLVSRFLDAEDPEPVLLTAPEQEFRIRELLGAGAAGWPDDLGGAAGTRAFAGQVRSALARARQLGLDPDDVAEFGRAAGDPAWEAVGRFGAEYLDVLDAEGALDYAELVHRARLLCERPEVRAAVRSGFGALYVDDWCELDPAQIALVRALAPDNLPVVALADPDTTSYGFRGAHPRAVAEFQRLFAAPGAPVPTVTLGVAHRQSPAQATALARVASRLGAPALEAATVAAYRSPHPAGQGSVRVRTYPDAMAQARGIAAELRVAHLEGGLPWSALAVLVRQGRTQLPPLAQALADAGIPVEVAGDEIGLAGELAVRPLMLALEVAGRGGPPDPDEAGRLLSSGWGGFDAVGLRALARALRAADPSAATRPSAELIAEALAGARPEPPGAEALAARRDLLARAAVRVRAGAPPAEVLWLLWDGSDWPAILRAEALGGGEGAPRANHDLDAVAALFDLARASAAPGGAAGVTWFAAEVARQQIPADSEREAAVVGRGVRLLTAHRAKGHHWPFLVVAGVQEGVWPDVRRRGSIFDPERLGSAGLGAGSRTRDLVAAERRLFLLACSRAEGQLLVTAVEGTEGEDNRPSRFLDELGVAPRRVTGAPRGLHTLRDLVASLRRAAQDPEETPAVRLAAAERLARLAQAVDDAGRPLAPDADPARWWGIHELTGTVAATPEGRLRVSPSQLESLLECPRRSFLQREARAQTPPSSTTLLGSVIHAVIERVAGEGLSLDEARAALDAVWEEIPFTAAWLSASERVEADLALDRYAVWQAAREDTELVGVEVGVDTQVEVDGHRVRIQGTIDRLERDRSGALWVVDFKTGRSLPTAAAASASIQLGAYQLALAQRGEPVAGASLVYLRVGDPMPRVFRQPSLIERPHLGDDPLELRYPTWVHHAVAQAAELLTSGTFDARPGAHCRWCPVRSSCPARSGQVVA